MQLGFYLRTCAVGAGFALAIASAPLALAQERQPGVAPDGPDTRPEWNREAAAPPAPPSAPRPMIEPGLRAHWLAECRRRISVRDDGLGGAVIGGVIGGVAGNRIAGRHHRTLGTVAGAAIGAAAGMAIDKAEDSRSVRDECETYLDDYVAYYAYHAAQPAYGYGYAHPAYAPSAYGCCRPGPAIAREPKCTETVEYVYEDVPVRPRARRMPSKRVRIVPDKRIRVD